jgi:hypothetical protein
MASPKQIAKEILKELTEAEIKKLSEARFDINKPGYTEEWRYMRKRLESVFNHFLVHEEERDGKTSKVINELKLLEKEKPRDPFEKTLESAEKIKQTERMVPDHFNQPEVEKKIDEKGNIYHEIKKSEDTETSRTKKIIPENAENAELFPELFNKPR